MSSVLDKINKHKKNLPSNNNSNGVRTNGIFANFEMGDNEERLVGEPVMGNGHFLAPNKKSKFRGFCPEDAFDRENENRLPKWGLCGKWDLDTETEDEDGLCYICLLNEIAHEVVTAIKDSDDVDEKTKKEWTELRSRANARANIKWNCFHRANPNVEVEDEDGNKEKKLGCKVISVGQEAYEGIAKQFTDLNCDITDPEEGVDIKITKAQGNRVNYSVSPVYDGKSVKETPFTDEERACEPHDLKVFFGGEVDQDVLLENLHPEHRKVIEAYQDGGVEAVLELSGFEIDNSDSESSKKSSSKKSSTGKSGKKSAKSSSKKKEDDAEKKKKEEEERKKKEAEKAKQEEEERKKKEAEDDEEDSDAEEELAGVGDDGELPECFGDWEDDHPECKDCDEWKACKEKTEG